MEKIGHTMEGDESILNVLVNVINALSLSIFRVD